jgi:hypothetical protein
VPSVVRPRPEPLPAGPTSLLGWSSCFGRRKPLSSGNRILSPWVGWPRPHRLERRRQTCGSARRRPQTPNHRGYFLYPPLAKLVEVVVDPQLQSLQNHTVGALHLPICHWLGYGGPVHTDVVVFAEVQELLPSELRAIVGDDGVRDLKGKCALGPFLSILVIKCPIQVPKC